MLIERFKMTLACGIFHVQREQNEFGTYYEVRLEDLSLPNSFGTEYASDASYMEALQAKAKELYDNQLEYCGVHELVGCFNNASLTRINLGE